MMARNEPQVEMPKQAPIERRNNFDEVATGYTEEMAQTEASRCLACKNPQCVKGCPVNVDIPGFITLIKEGKYIEAAKEIKESNALPAISGRVCPQENQCQKTCIRGIRGDPIAIGRLERFAADYERANSALNTTQINTTNGKVAVVGSGPSGLTVAAELQRMGHQVEVFESLHRAGGVLIYGIPEFRLPKDIVRAEVDYVRSLGVEIHLDSTIGRLYTIPELFEKGFEAVYIGSGAGLPNFMDSPGENLTGI
jgi:glutamate synthase (NADPH/NADH) small chain